MRRMWAGLWFLLSLALPAAVFASGQPPLDRFLIGLVVLAAGATTGFRVLLANQTRTAGRAAGIGARVAVLSALLLTPILYLIRHVGRATAPSAGRAPSLESLISGLLVASGWLAWLVLLSGTAGALAGVTLYALRRLFPALAVRGPVAPSGLPESPELGNDSDEAESLGRWFGRVAWAQLITGALLICLNALILLVGLRVSPADPMIELVQFLTARGDTVPTAVSPGVSLGPLFLVGTLLVASGLMTLTRKSRAYLLLAGIHVFLAGTGSLGALAGLSHVNPYGASPVTQLAVPCALLAWTSFRFLMRLRSSFDAVATENGARRAPATMPVALACWALAAIYILYEGPGNPDDVIRRLHEDETSWARKIQFSPDGRSLISCLGTEVVLLDSRTGVIRSKTREGLEVHAIAFSHNSRYLAWAAPSQYRTQNPAAERTWDPPDVVPSDVSLGVVQVWKLPEPGEPSSLQPVFGADRRCRCDPSSLSFSRDDKSLMVGTQDGTGTVWKLDMATGDLAPAFRAYGPDLIGQSPSSGIEDLAYTRDGQTLATLGRDSLNGPLTCKTWNAATWEQRKAFSIAAAGAKQHGRLLAQADTILLLDDMGRTFIWQIDGQTRQGPIGDPRCPRGRLSFSPAGDLFAVTCGYRLDVFAFPSRKSIASAAPWHRWPLPVPPLLAVSPDGSVAGTDADYPSDHRSIRVWRFGAPRSDRRLGP